MNSWVTERIEQRLRLLQAFEKAAVPVAQASEYLITCLKSGGRIYTFGNGGSASQASHFAAELVNRFYRDRPGLPAIALVTDCAGLTAIGNDSDFENVFSRQVDALGNPGDTAIGITTSGRSANVLKALKNARKKGMRTMALCGKHTGPLLEAGTDLILSVPDTDTPAIQEIHLFILHMLAERVEAGLFP
ncbi:MAG: SIS domain-containing protein [Acidobacteriota bacterium]|nr:SIS domain-containing protein [Acidobacteriota bacterium]